jgi:hypothetical protein
MAAEGKHYDGGCTCRHLRYRMTSKPMFVHCCHCRWCQRETGASFGCPKCRVAVWSNYALPGGIGAAVHFIRVGTLDDPDRIPPDIHIFTSTKQPWLVLPPNAPAVDEYYRTGETWPRESLDRRAVLLDAASR